MLSFCFKFFHPFKHKKLTVGSVWVRDFEYNNHKNPFYNKFDINYYKIEDIKNDFVSFKLYRGNPKDPMASVIRIDSMDVWTLSANFEVT